MGGSANGALGFSQGDKTSRNADFRVFNIPIVDGTGGGTTTTDPSKVVVFVDGYQVIPSMVDGRNGLVTLATSPAPGATVSIRYYANTWQDTFDYLPNTLVTGWNATFSTALTTFYPFVRLNLTAMTGTGIITAK